MFHVKQKNTTWKDKKKKEGESKMIENPMIMRNGYGIPDPQEYEPMLQKDVCGCEILPDDDLLVSPDGEVLLRENAARYIISMLGFQQKRGGF
ncbi:hypothetical protein JDS99_22525 [Bacillus cereus group sp. N6]|uniref:YqaI family protein n=1 Tax=Bacillus cereus group sp. N6 TaxID=2794583 RepID=UPI0018F2B8B4|nr:hypothetical protein [Bacillus cereus group sp. N6]MBJ8112366.1 hypothetical protein [Bacillus cereus group sp. N6]